jgi:hypothetical protein
MTLKAADSLDSGYATIDNVGQRFAHQAIGWGIRPQLCGSLRRRTATINDGCARSLGLLAPMFFTDDGLCAAMDGLTDIKVTVGLLPLPSHKEVAWPHVAAVKASIDNWYGRKRKRWQIARQRLPQNVLCDLGCKQWPQG